MRIGFIGTGTIASALVRGIAGDGHDITVSERSAANAAALARDFTNVTVADNQAVLDRSDIVFLGLMAEQAAEVLGDLRFRPDQQVISLMAGATLEQVAALVAPAQAPAMMLPFPAIAQGGSPILAMGDCAVLEPIFTPKNQIIVAQSPQEMAAYLCAQAVLSPVARMIDDTARWLAPQISDPGQSETFLRALVASALPHDTAAGLIAALNTPGGYNQRLRLHMEQAGMGAALTAGLDALKGDA